MLGPSAALRFSLPAGATACLAFVCALAAADGPRIVKPHDGALLPAGALDVIALASEGGLTLNGETLSASQPFPGVLLAKLKLTAGTHVLELSAEHDTQRVTFQVTDAVNGSDGALYRHHPPLAVECTQCHGVSRRGRFRFGGGCDSCHAPEPFIRTHSHQPHELSSCGMCHDAHGSSAAKLLVLPREQACKQCHN